MRDGGRPGACGWSPAAPSASTIAVLPRRFRRSTRTSRFSRYSTAGRPPGFCSKGTTTWAVSMEIELPHPAADPGHRRPRVIAPHGHPSPGAASRTNYAGRRFFRERGSGAARCIEPELRLGQKPQRALEMGNTEAIKRAVAAGGPLGRPRRASPVWMPPAYAGHRGGHGPARLWSAHQEGTRSGGALAFSALQKLGSGVPSIKSVCHKSPRQHQA